MDEFIGILNIFLRNKFLQEIRNYIILLTINSFSDELLHSDRVCDIALPRLAKRQVLEEGDELEPRISPLEIKLDDLDDEDEESDEEDSVNSDNDSFKKEKKRKSRSRERDNDRHVNLFLNLKL